MLARLANIALFMALLAMLISHNTPTGEMLLWKYQGLLFIAGGLLLGAITNALLIVLEQGCEH